MQRHYFANKGLSSQSFGFSSSHVWMWELDYKESLVPKNWCIPGRELKRRVHMDRPLSWGASIWNHNLVTQVLGSYVKEKSPWEDCWDRERAGEAQTWLLRSMHMLPYQWSGQRDSTLYWKLPPTCTPLDEWGELPKPTHSTQTDAGSGPTSPGKRQVLVTHTQILHLILAKGPYSQGYGLPSGHIGLGELDCKEGRTPKNWYLQTAVLEKTPENPLDSKEIKPVNLKGNEPWILIGRTDAKTEAPVFWSLDVNSQLIGKVCDAGKDWRQKGKRT